MNNSAFSFVYRTIKGSMQDAFESNGEGFGKTYNFKYYPARIDYIFADKNIQIKTEINGEAQRPWRPKVVYHYIQWQTIEPDFVVDISDFMTQKMEAVQAYSSQFYDPNSKEPVTPIASKNFLESIQYRAKDLGRLVGVEYAEGFTVERYVTVNSLGDLK